MKQEFYDSKGNKKGEDTSGSLAARIKMLEDKIRSMAGVPKPTPTPKAKKDPMGTKKGMDKKINPDTGEMAQPGDPTVRYDGSRGSGPSYHFNGEPRRGESPIDTPAHEARESASVERMEHRTGKEFYDGASPGGPSGGPMPLGVPVGQPQRAMSAHRHMPGMPTHSHEMAQKSATALPMTGALMVDSHMKE